MKKLAAILLVCGMVLSAVGCGVQKIEAWSEGDFILTADGGESVNLGLEQGIAVYEDYSFVNSHVNEEYEESEIEYATARGLKIGSSFEDYRKLYAAAKSYAVWEVIDETNGYTQFLEYTGQDFKEMLEQYGNVWLDLGFKKIDGKWKAMKDVEVQDVWFCDADYEKYEEVAILCVNFDYTGEVVGIALDYVNYNEDFAAYQAWEEE